MNPLYNMLMGGNKNPVANQPQASYGGPVFQNPLQKMNYIMQAMRNPAAFVKQHIPDIPNEIANDPNQILRYLQQTRGVTDQDIQQVASQIPANGFNR